MGIPEPEDKKKKSIIAKIAKFIGVTLMAFVGGVVLAGAGVCFSVLFTPGLTHGQETVTEGDFVKLATFIFIPMFLALWVVIMAWLEP